MVAALVSAASWRVFGRATVAQAYAEPDAVTAAAGLGGYVRSKVSSPAA